MILDQYQEKYIEHEVQLRLIDKTINLNDKANDREHRELRDMIKEIRLIYRVTMGAFVTAVLLPIVLHYFKLI